MWTKSGLGRIQRTVRIVCEVALALTKADLVMSENLRFGLCLWEIFMNISEIQTE